MGDGPLPEGVLLLETLVGHEALGAPYVFELGLLSKLGGIEPDGVVGQPLAVGVRLGSGGQRWFHGVVTSFARAGVTHAYTRYVARLNPGHLRAAGCRVSTLAVAV